MDEIIEFDDGIGKHVVPIEPLATPKQMAWLRDLLVKQDWRGSNWNDKFKARLSELHAAFRDHNPEEVNNHLAKPVTMAGFRKLLPELQQLHPVVRSLNRQAKRPDLEDGIYRHMPQGTIYKVYTTQHGHPATKRLYQKSDGDWAFKYEGQAPLHFLKVDERMELADAIQFGHIYSQCVVCARTLTDELSMALGIGPICGNHEFGNQFTIMRDAKKKELGL